MFSSLPFIEDKMAKDGFLTRFKLQGTISAELQSCCCGLRATSK